MTDHSPSAANTATVRLERDGPIGFLILDNPARHNALSAAMWRSIPEQLGAALADDAVRVIVIRGAGDKAFSAGADISEFETARSGDAAKAYDALNEAAFNALQAAHKPIIAMIHGFCMGGGLGIAACCDMRLSDEAGQFAIPAAKLGIGYDPRWVRTLLALAAPSRVKELIFTGRRFPAPQALAMGLVDRVVPAPELASVVRALADEIAANAPLTIRAAKAAIDGLTRQPEGADITRLKALSDACMQSADYAEGRRAFLEKRRPQFRGL